MKWVKYILNVDPKLTIDKTYKVIEYFVEDGEEYVKIITDNGKLILYAIYAGVINSAGAINSERGRIKWFEDVTNEVREKKINSILDYGD